MDKFFTESFYKFLFGFSLIVILSFGILIFLGNKNAELEEGSVDTTTQTATQ